MDDIERRVLEVYRRYYFWQEIGRELRRRGEAMGSQYGDGFEAEIEGLVDDLGHDTRALFLAAQDEAKAAAEKISDSEAMPEVPKNG